MGVFLSALRKSLKLFNTQRRLWLPFLFVLAFEVLIIFAVWLAPHPPLDKFLAPPIRFFFGDRVLHYPAHLWFLYHAMKHAQLVAMVLLGAFMTGIASVMVKQFHEEQPASIHAALKTRQVKYGRVLLIWLIAWGISRVLVEFTPQWLPETRWMLLIVVGFLLFLQAIFLYAIPYAVLQNNSWWRALLKSVGLALRRPFTTLFFVTLPSIPLLLMSYFMSSASMSKVVFQTIPELVFIFIFIRFAVWTIADAFMSVAAAHVWMLTEGKREAQQPVQDEGTKA